MGEYKSIRDLIVKAALYDGVSTTISPYKLTNGREILKITFRKEGRYISTLIGTMEEYSNHEEIVLLNCKRALNDLLFAPYDEIEVDKEN